MIVTGLDPVIPRSKVWPHNHTCTSKPRHRTFKSISPSCVAITGAQPASELVQLSIIVSHMYTSFKTKQSKTDGKLNYTLFGDKNPAVCNAHVVNCQEIIQNLVSACLNCAIAEFVQAFKMLVSSSGVRSQFYLVSCFHLSKINQRLREF